jgi:hypothetical protein
MAFAIFFPQGWRITDGRTPTLNGWYNPDAIPVPIRTDTTPIHQVSRRWTLIDDPPFGRRQAKQGQDDWDCRSHTEPRRQWNRRKQLRRGR